jgi:molybdopterin biosynthesis enzyme
MLHIKVLSGGDDRNRTCDPLNANQVLSQPTYLLKKMVAGTGFEPATFGL